MIPINITELLLKRDNVKQVNATSWSDISTPLTELLSNCAEMNSNKKLILQCVKVVGACISGSHGEEIENSQP